MTEVLWPPDLCPSSQTWNIIGNAATFTSPLSGATRTYGRPGARMGCTMTFPPMKGQDRARLLAFINTLLDRSNRAWVPDFSTTRRGSFSVSELLTNNDFSNGTTGWLPTLSTLSAHDRRVRVTSTRGAAGPGTPGLYQQPALAQGVPYVLRGHSVVSGNVLTTGTYLVDSAGAGPGGFDNSVSGLKVQSMVASAAGACTALPALMGTGVFLAGDHMDVTYASLARCFLVDGGGNRLKYSDQIDNAAWAVGSVTVSGNSHTAPNGETAADSLVETGSSDVGHYVLQDIAVPSAASEVSFSASVLSVTRAWCALLMTEAAGSSSAYVFVNLTTGAVGTVFAGSNWSNARAHVVDQGGGWYRISLTARKTNSATSVACVINPATADASFTYAGSAATVALAAWRASASLSALPVRGIQTIAATVSPSAQTGSGIYVKGLPASTQGLLEAGDPVQIGGQINFLTARLDSDAAGKGYLQCGRPWLAATNDAPVIVHQPMCKMILATDTIDLDTGPGQFSPFQIELVEAIE